MRSLCEHRLDGLVWQVGYWTESVTPALLEALVDYVCGQRVHHGDRAFAEPWETNLL